MQFRLFLGAVCIGFAPIFVRLLTLAPTPIGMYRCGLAALMLFAWVLSSKSRTSFHPSKYSFTVWRLLLTGGALFALDLFVWHRSVIYAGAGMGTILGNTQVFYVALIGIFFYREKPTLLFIFSIFLAFAGIYLLVNFRTSSENASNYQLGVIFGLVTGIVYATYILTMRQLESLNNLIRTEHALAFVSLFAALFLFPISFFEGSLRLPSPMEWVWLLSLSFIAQVIGWLLITKTLPKTPVSKAGLILNAQPVVAVIAGDLILHERLSGIQMVGAALTIAAIYIGTRKKRTAIKLQ